MLQFLAVLFRGTYCGVPPIFKTLILVHLNEIGLSMKILLGSWCIRHIREIYDFHIAHLKQIQWSNLSFPQF